MSKLFTLTIDGQEVTVPEGTLIVDAAKKIGIDIPVFCYHPKMEPVGMCRMCLVEIGRPVIDRATGQPLREANGALKIQFGPKLDTACTTPVSEGMVVVGMSDKVKAARKDIVEFILTSHPLDCPVCDKGGECPLQNLTMGFGSGQSRFIYDDKMHLAKHVPLGELIFLDRERCIQCGRCVRFQDTIADDPVIGFYHRGRSLEIVTHSEPGFNSYFSGNTSDICPVGAITTADFRFGARPWEMTATASICPHCPVGCNLTFNVRREAKTGGDIVIKRTLPRQNEAVNEIWICDKGRFGHHFAESAQRLTEPLVRMDGELVPASWEVALALAAESIKEAGSGLLALGSGRLSNEDLFNLKCLADGLGGKAALYTYMAGGDLAAQVGVGQGTNLGELGKGSAILVVASDLEEEAPIWWLRVKQAAQRGATLVVANPRPTKTDRHASYKLRYAYGDEADTVQVLINALPGKSKGPTSPEIAAAASAIAQAENLIVFYGSEGLGLAGSQGVAQACANLLVSSGHFGRANNGLIPVWSRANDQGAWEIGLRPVPDLAEAIKQAKALYMVGADPAGDDPGLAEAIRSDNFVIVQELFLTETARLADVVLPALPFTERDGSLTSGERRVQRFYPAVLPRGEARSDFAITGQISQLAGLDVEAGSAARVFARLAARVPAFSGLTFRQLAQTGEQWPLIGRSDLYYGGTAYDNKQGLGLHLAPARTAPSLSAAQAPARIILDGGLLAVPVTRLYDRGLTISATELLGQRLAQPYVAIHPAEAERLGVAGAKQVVVKLGEWSAVVWLRLDASLPAGVVLVPRSLGMPVHAPTAVELAAAAELEAV
jgi:NADH-quinone oxidoreductase subunit G